MDNHFSAHINSILLCTALDYEFMIVASELCAVTPVEYMYLELSTTSLSICYYFTLYDICWHIIYLNTLVQHIIKPPEQSQIFYVV